MHMVDPDSQNDGSIRSQYALPILASAGAMVSPYALVQFLGSSSVDAFPRLKADRLLGAQKYAI